MPISSAVRKAGPFSGAGTTATFPFTFKVFQASDLYVVRLNVSTDIETVLTINSDYTVSLNADQDTSPGGDVVLSSVLATGYTLVITSSVENLQPTDLTNQGGFYPSVITDSLDRACIQIQQLQEEVDRAVVVPITSSVTVDELTADLILLADNMADLDTLVTNIADINTVADDLNDPASKIETVAESIADVNTVSSNIADVNTVADAISDITTVADNMASVVTVAQNIDDVTNFADVYYGPSATEPTTRRDGSALQDGDLYLNTSTGVMRVYNSGTWISSVPGSVFIYNASGDDSTTSFTLDITPDSENVTQVYVTGIYQQKSTYSLSGNVITFSSAPPTGTNNIEVVTLNTLPVGSVVWNNVVGRPFVDSDVMVNTTTSASALGYTSINVTDGGMFNVAAGVTFTVDVPFSCGLFQCFAGDGDVEGLDEVYPEWFGNDWNKAFSASFNVRLKSGSYTLDNIKVLLNSADESKQYRIVGSGRTTLNLINYTSGYVFYLNADSSTGEAVNNELPRHTRLIIENLYIDGTGSTSPKFLRANGSSFELKHCTFLSMLSGVERSNYCDQVRIDQVYWFSPKTGGRFFTDVTGTDMPVGDSLLVNQFFTSNNDAFYLENVNGAVFNACNGGRYTFQTCTAIQFNGGHFEFPDTEITQSAFEIKNSSVTLNDCYVLSSNGSAGYEPIKVNDDTSVLIPSHVKLSSVRFYGYVNDSYQSVNDINWVSTNIKGGTLVTENCSYGIMNINPNTGISTYYPSNLTTAIAPAITGTFVTSTGNYKSINSDVIVSYDYNKTGWSILPSCGISKLKVLPKPSISVADSEIAGTLASGNTYYKAYPQGVGYINSGITSDETTLSASGTTAPVITFYPCNPSIVRLMRTDAVATTWTNGAVFAAKSWCTYLGNSYWTSAGGTTGATPPTHTTGSASDGTVTWIYAGSGVGDYSTANSKYVDIPIALGGVCQLWDKGASLGNRFVWSSSSGGVAGIVGVPKNIYGFIDFTKPAATSGAYLISVSGSGAPENNVSAEIGSIYSNISGGASTTLYVKTSGTSTTGWTAK